MDGLVRCQSWILVKLSIKEIQFYRYVQRWIQNLSEGAARFISEQKKSRFRNKKTCRKIFLRQMFFPVLH